ISTCGVVPRTPMVATGVSIFISPVLAILPATNVNVPLVRLNNVELDFPFGSYTNSLKAMRALLDRLNEVPSEKLIRPGHRPRSGPRRPGRRDRRPSSDWLD